ncbi:S8 family serine peptidase [Kribbella sp. NBC_00359]|uniref:S8 family serine peptidase n=1 Tax=Kribbella sp. NBC_00359 TaxID=2975966 RepID=UPI002E1B7E8C
MTSAGDRDTDACFNPVGSAPAAITVGATDVTDTLWTESPDHGSNWGACVDIFAPGAGITSIGGIGHLAHPNDPNPPIDPDPLTKSGTSASAAHVSGAVALLLGTPKFATATPAQIAAELDAQSTRGIIQGLPDGLSPNKLLFVRPTSPRTGTTIALAPNANGALTLFGTNADGSTTGGTDLGGHMFTGTQTDAHNNTWPTQWEQSRGQRYASMAAGADGNGITSKMVLADLTAQDEVFHRQQAVVNDPSWLAQSQLDGPLTTAAIAPNADHRLTLIGADKHGTIFYRSQRTAADDTSWDHEGIIDFSGDAQNVTAAPDSLGRINVFIADTHGVLWYTRQTAPQHRHLDNTHTTRRHRPQTPQRNHRRPRRRRQTHALRNRRRRRRVGTSRKPPQRRRRLPRLDPTPTQSSLPSVRGPQQRQAPGRGRRRQPRRHLAKHPNPRHQQLHRMDQNRRPHTTPIRLGPTPASSATPHRRTPPTRTPGWSAAARDRQALMPAAPAPRRCAGDLQLEDELAVSWVSASKLPLALAMNLSVAALGRGSCPSLARGASRRCRW